MKTFNIIIQNKQDGSETVIGNIYINDNSRYVSIIDTVNLESITSEKDIHVYMREQLDEPESLYKRGKSND